MTWLGFLAIMVLGLRFALALVDDEARRMAKWPGECERCCIVRYFNKLQRESRP